MELNRVQLHKACNASFKALRAMGAYTECKPKGSGFTFIDNGSNVLGVAHIDTVQSSHKFESYKKTVQSPRLDDRLGVYTLLYALPSIGINLDILLTENEEIGQSTAQFFETEKEYNWIVEFDRSGEDVVLYQFETMEAIEALSDIGFDIGQGSYTDICELDDLGVMAFNVGVGYYKPHSLHAFMRPLEYKRQIDKFVAFYRSNKDTRFEFDIADSLAYAPSCRYTYTRLCPVCGGIVWNLTHFIHYGMCMECGDTCDRWGLDKLYTSNRQNWL